MNILIHNNDRMLIGTKTGKENTYGADKESHPMIEER